MKTISPEVLLVLSLGIAMIPLMISVGTCYLKFSIVLSLLRSGFGTQQAPSTALVMALSLVMSLMVMHPVLSKSTEKFAEIKFNELSTLSISGVSNKIAGVLEPWKSFLVEHSGEKELTIFTSMIEKQKLEEVQPVDREKVPVTTALASFVLSEIKKGFTLAFFLLIPFFVIDLIVANLLVAMGLTMMSPVIVSLPIKLLLFVTTDGWLLLARNLIQAYQ